MEQITKEQVGSKLDSLTVLELKEWVDFFKDKFGVTFAAGGAVAAAGPAAAAAEEQTEFTVTLKETGDKKINVIKVVRALTGLGLKEAKDLVDAAPKTVKAGVSKDEAQKMKTELEKEGAKVELS